MFSPSSLVRLWVGIWAVQISVCVCMCVFLNHSLSYFLRQGLNIETRAPQFVQTDFPASFRDSLVFLSLVQCLPSFYVQVLVVTLSFLRSHGKHFTAGVIPPYPSLIDGSEDFRTLSPSMRKPIAQELSLSRSLLCIDGKEKERGTGREQADTCAKGVRQVIAGLLFETRQESFARLRQSSLEQGLRTSAASCGPAGSSLRCILLSS